MLDVRRLTNARALKDERRTESTTTDNDLLSCTIDLGLVLSRSKGLSGNSLDTNSSTTFHNDLLNLGVADQVQVTVDRTSAVDVCVSRV